MEFWGFLALLSLQLTKEGGRFFSPDSQSYYLNRALADDFPKRLPRASEMVTPGRVPCTGGQYVFIHEHNVAWLSHLALMHAKDGQTTDTLEHDLITRICRLLLIANDLIYKSKFEFNRIPTLTKRRAFVALWLRNWQFNKFQDYYAPFIALAREYRIMEDWVPKYFPNLEDVFHKATKSLTLERYYQTLSVFTGHIYAEMTYEDRWLRRSTFCKNIEENKEVIESIAHSWTRTPEQYRKRSEEWRSSRKSKDVYPTFDFVPLYETPLIEARPGDLICPVMGFLLDKIINGPFYIITDYLNLNNQRKERASFHEARGHAYEDYAHSLIKKIAESDIVGLWICYKNITLPEDSELADSYLQKGKIGINFEHKGGRLPTNYLLGAEEERVFGPRDEVLKRLDKGEPIEAQEALRDGADEGLITKAMWQQSVHADNLRQWAAKKIGTTPEKIFPLICHYADIRIDELCRAGYLEPLIEATNLYSHDFLEAPQWLHISDLEDLLGLAEQGKLNLELLLNEKAKPENRKKAFDIFLTEKYKGKRFIPDFLRTTINELLKNTGKTFWPSAVDWEKLE
jgi:hypothetical protein